MTALSPSEREAVASCPFCGETTSINGLYNEGWVMRCWKCRAEGPATGTKNEALPAWNRRAPSPEVEALREALRDLIPLAEDAMGRANSDGAEYDIEGELKVARALLGGQT